MLLCKKRRRGGYTCVRTLYEQCQSPLQRCAVDIACVAPYLAIMHCTMRLIIAAIAAAQCSAISAASKLRAVLRAPGAVVCPGVHDALSTRVFAEAGADVLFLSGFGVSACRGEPDAGIITRVEMEDVARQCVRAAGDVPLIVDGDTGFGGASNLRRTIRGFAQAGAAAVSISA